MRLVCCLAWGLLAWGSAQAQQTTQKNAAQWRQIDSLMIVKGMYAKAQKQVEALGKQAWQQKDYPQWLKAFMYTLKVNKRLEKEEQDAFVKNIQFTRHTLKKAPTPIVKAILHQVLANLYHQYLDFSQYRTRYSYSKYTKDSTSVEYWTDAKIHSEIVQQCHWVLKDEKLLQHTSTQGYRAILQGSDKNRKYRPTLYDLLAHRSIEILSYAYSYKDKGYQKIFAEPAQAYSTPKVFVKLRFAPVKPSASRYQLAAQLWQRLTRLHLASGNQLALASLTLARIANMHASLEIVPPYLAALRRFEQRYQKLPISAEATYLIAYHYYLEGMEYKRNGQVFPEHRAKLKKAYKIAQAGAAKFTQGLGKLQNKALVNLMLEKRLDIQFEQVVAPKQPFIISIDYRNLPQVYWRVIKLNTKKQRRLRAYTSEQHKEKINDLTRLKPYRSWSTTLPNPGDYQPYRVEEKVDALPIGEYALVLSGRPDFATQSNRLVYQYFTVTSLNYIERKLDYRQKEIYIIDRASGQPLSGVKASLFVEHTPKKSDKKEIIKIATYRSDKNGLIKVDTALHPQPHFFIFKKGRDHFSTYRGSLYERPYAFFAKEKSKDELKTYFFTDRGIYRPGQTVHFKGIVTIYNTDTQKYKVARPHIATITLGNSKDIVKTLRLKVNEFGSFSGTFILPKNGMTGNYNLEYLLESIPLKKGEKVTELHQNQKKYLALALELENSGNDFRVEEYKRPKFNVSFVPIKKRYKLGQTIALKGKAEAYAGVNIDGAKVKYSVQREALVVSVNGHKLIPAKEIISGDTVTNAQGEFWVKWQALSDSATRAAANEVFTFIVKVEVTDLNGETRQQTYELKLGHYDTNIAVKLSATIDPRLPATAQLKATNLDGQAVASHGTITVYRLEVPQRYTKERYWAAPDQFNYSQSQWAAIFPHALYGKVKYMEDWKKLEVVQQHRYELDPKDPASNRLVLKNTQWQAGQYVLVMRTGNGLETIRFFTVQASNSTQLIIPKVDYFKPVKTEAKVGESAQIWLGSSERTWALLLVHHRDSVVSRQWKLLNKERWLWQIPVQPKYRGNFSVQAIFMRDNRWYQHTQLIEVPFADKKLDVRFETFRNKLLPGEKEKWRIKIKGANNTKVAAEMLATLYDASLEAFVHHYFQFYPFPDFRELPDKWKSPKGFIWYKQVSSFQSFQWSPFPNSPYYRNHQRLHWFGYKLSEWYEQSQYKKDSLLNTGQNSNEWQPIGIIPQPEILEVSDEEEINITTGLYAPRFSNGPLADNIVVTIYTNPKPAIHPKPRTNFNETAFFYPHLRTDAEGSILVEFTVPESLTRWRMLGFAHTKDLKNGIVSNSLVTQKELMVVPNAPRFFRESDQLTLSAKITNLSAKALSGNSQLQLFDALTNQPIDAEVLQSEAKVGFATQAGQSTVVSWQLKIPVGVQAITYRIMATAGNFSDGEEMTLPVLSNRILLTESLPLTVNAGETKTFSFKNLQNSRQSKTLRHHQLTLEFTPNPVWYALQALPYLMEFPHECAEQTFSRVYANTLAAHVLRSNPKIKRVFDLWKTQQPEALMSNFDKNPGLRAMLLSETPWVLKGKTDAQRKRRLGLLFDLNRMTKEQARAFDKLEQMQTSEGGFPWFGGMRPSRYISQHIVGGLAHLEQLGVSLPNTRAMALKGLNYLDKKAGDDYQELLKQARQDSAAYRAQRKRLKVPQAQIDLWANKLYQKYLQKPHLSQLLIQYLYVRSFYPKVGLLAKGQQVFDFYMAQAQRYWQRYDLQTQGMIALAMHRAGKQTTAQAIVNSLKKRSIYSPNKGRYWQLPASHYWYQAPIETQAIMIEVFEEVAQDSKMVEELKIWLLNQKRTQSWATTKATTEACYALLMRGEKWLAQDNQVEVTLGQEKVSPHNESDLAKVEAGSGYFKKRWKAEAIRPEMGNIRVQYQGKTPAWGAVYWQYFEQLDKVKAANNSLTLSKHWWLKTQTPKGEKWVLVKPNTRLKVGDLIKVELKLYSPQAMEYVHLKDMRASALEPLNVLSSYQYRNGLGYFQSTRDAATHFFIDYLPQGKHSIQYQLRVTHQGNFSDGISTIESMYAPEFKSHSEGKKLRVK